MKKFRVEFQIKKIINNLIVNSKASSVVTNEKANKMDKPKKNDCNRKIEIMKESINEFEQKSTKKKIPSEELKINKF